MSLSLNVNGALAAFLLACAVYFLFGEVINFAITDAQAQRVFRGVLLFICIAIVVVVGFFVR